MNLPSWQSRKDFYEALTLPTDGDALEREGALKYELAVAGKSFPNYLVFWRRHIAPATHRPYSTEWREHAHNDVALVGQHNYSIFYHLYSAHHYLGMAQPEAPGEHQRRFCFTALMHAGNAIEVVDELLIAITQLVANYRKRSKCLPRTTAALFGSVTTGAGREAYRWDASLTLFQERGKLLQFRHFLTHEGIPHTEYIVQGGKEVPLVYLDQPSAGRPARGNVWVESHKRYLKNPAEFKPLRNQCVQLLERTTKWLNDVYEKAIQEMDALVADPDYPRMWGWQHVVGCNCNIDKDILSPKVVLCCGEDYHDLLRAFEKNFAEHALRQHAYRCYRFWKYRHCTLIWTGIGTGCLEPLLSEILGLAVKEVKEVVLIGTAGKTRGSKVELGKVYQISDAYAHRTALDACAHWPLHPTLPFPSLAKASCLSTDLYYAPARDAQLKESFAKVVQETGVQLLDMEVAQFYYLCAELDPALKYVAIKGAANELGNGEQQLVWGPGVLDECVRVTKEWLQPKATRS